MRQFYKEYKELPKLQPLVRETSWAKNLVILARVKDPLEREFYLRATARFGWTKAVLQHQIDNQSAHPEIPWRQIIAVRNRVIHAYLGIDDDIIWSIIRDDIPVLLVALKRLKN
jgi:hypothetical protein